MPSDSDRPPSKARDDTKGGTYRIVDESRKERSSKQQQAKAPSLADLVDLDDERVCDDEAAADDAPAGTAGGDDAGSSDEGDDPPTIDDVEPLLAKGDYQAICERLGPLDRAEQLSPALALLYATARKELGTTEVDEDVNPLAIRSVASLLDVSASSRTALMIAKRVIRKNPVAWQKRKAPGAPARLVLIIFGLAIGIVGGWLAGPGTVQLQEVIETMMR